MPEKSFAFERISPALFALLASTAVGLSLLAVFTAPFWLGAIVSIIGTSALAVAAVARTLLGDTVPALLFALATEMLLVGLLVNVWVRSRREGFTIFVEDWSDRGFLELFVRFVPAFGLHFFAVSMMPGIEALMVYLTEAGGCPPWLVTGSAHMVYVLLIAPLVAFIGSCVIALLGSLLSDL